jgi:hypothetical protein
MPSPRRASTEAARHLNDAGDGGKHRSEHEQNNGHAIDRHSEIARRLLVLSARLDPAAEPCSRQEKGAKPANQKRTRASTF